MFKIGIVEIILFAVLVTVIYFVVKFFIKLNKKL